MKNVEIINGDCLEVMEVIPDRSIDLIVADMPYGCTYNNWDSLIDTDLLWPIIERVVKDNAAIVLFGQGKFTAKMIVSNLDMYRYSLVWRKTMPVGFLDARRKSMNLHEDIMVFSKQRTKYNPQMREGRPYSRTRINDVQSGNYNTFKRHGTTKNDGKRFPVSVIEFSNGNNKSKHKTQKPVDLLSWLIKTYSDEGDTVLDFCAGSGSTGIACLDTGRKSILIEKDPEIFEIAKQRVEEHISQNIFLVDIEKEQAEVSGG